jgi:hypothetical protein
MAEEKLRITITADNKDALAKFNQTIAGLDGISSASGKAGGATKKLGTDFTGMSRVLQDLPFGFMAIQNNLTQLLPAAGAAGLAFSALMAGIQFAQVGLTYWTRGIKESDEALQASTKSVTDFNVKLVDAKTNFQSARAGVLSKDEALKKYNETLGSSIGYAKTMQEAEALMVKNTATVVQSINLRTQAQLFAAKAAELQAKISTGEVYNMSLMEQAVTGAKAAFGGLGSIASAAANEMSSRYVNANKNIEQFNKLSQDALTKAINLEKTLVGSRTAPQSGGGGGKPKEVAVKDENKVLEEQIQIYKRLQAQMMGQGFITQEKAKEKDLTNLKLRMDSNAQLNEITARQIELDDQKNARVELANQLTDRAMQGITGIANAMVNGGNIGEAFGNMFKQLAIDIAMAAARAAIFQGILMALPGLGGGAGAGKFLTGFGKLLGFSQGGTVSGPQSGYPVMLHGTEHIVRPDQMKSIIASASQMGGSNSSRVMVEGIIRGNDIFLSQQRTGTFRSLTT